MNNSELGSREYWKSECLRLRAAWGDKSFYQPIEKAGRAMSGLLYVWMNTKDATQEDTDLMCETSMEYDRRLLHVIMNPIPSSPEMI